MKSEVEMIMAKRTSGVGWKYDWIPKPEKPCDSELNSGVYYILCKTTRQGYIGSAKHIQMRIKDHFGDLVVNKHDNKNLQQAFNRYGWDDFTWGVIESCPTLELEKREQYWIDRYPIDRLFNMQRKVKRTLRVTWINEAEALGYIKQYCGLELTFPHSDNGSLCWNLIHDLSLKPFFSEFYTFSMDGRSVAVGAFFHRWGEPWPEFKREDTDTWQQP